MTADPHDLAMRLHALALGYLTWLQSATPEQTELWETLYRDWSQANPALRMSKIHQYAAAVRISDIVEELTR